MPKNLKAKRKLAGRKPRLDDLYDEDTGELTSFGEQLLVEAKQARDVSRVVDETTGEYQKRQEQIRFYKRTGKLPRRGKK